MEYKLQKTNENGSLQYWRCFVNGNEIITQWGVFGGKEQNNKQIVYEGKNIGKKNEKTKEEVAIFEAERMTRKKIEKGYLFTDETQKLTSVSKEAKTVYQEVPKPMLALDYNKHKSKVEKYNEVDIQAKLDGSRCLYNIKTQELYSRSRRKIISLPGFSELIASSFKNLDENIEWIDGELYSHELSFNEIQSILRKSKDIDPEKTQLIKYNVFDIITDSEWDKRKLWLNKIIKNNHVDVVPFETVNISQLKEKHDEYIQKGYEGIMIRIPNGVYENKRSKYLLKYKVFKDEEYKVIWIISEDHNKNKLGSVICELEDGTQFNARPAMTVEEKAKIWNNKQEYIGMMATVRFQEKDSKTNIPRFPVLHAFRNSDDK